MARSQASGSGLSDPEELNGGMSGSVLDPEEPKGGMSGSVLVPTELTASISSRSTV